MISALDTHETVSERGFGIKVKTSAASSAPASSKDRKSERRRPVMPAVSRAGGGLMPGIDLTDPSTLQEADDLDYVRWMQRFE